MYGLPKSVCVVPVIPMKQRVGIGVGSLWILFKQSLDSGVIDQSLKKGAIVPIFKSDDRTVPSNYRPISLTSVIIKVFERVIRNK